MYKKTLMALLGGLLSVALNVQAAGELMVFPATAKLFNAHEKMIKVRNVGDEPLYLSVKLMKVTNPGLDPEVKVALGDLPSPGVMATPERLTLGPNQNRDIRLTSLGEPAQESLYRLYITPVKSLHVENAPLDKITAPMTVSIGYGVLVRHMPAPAQQKTGWTHRCEAGKIILTNTGNVRVRISDILLNDSKKSLAAVGLFPGTPQTFQASKMTMNVADKPVTVSCR